MNLQRIMMNEKCYFPSNTHFRFSLISGANVLYFLSWTWLRSHSNPVWKRNGYTPEDGAGSTVWWFRMPPPITSQPLAAGGRPQLTHFEIVTTHWQLWRVELESISWGSHGGSEDTGSEWQRGNSDYSSRLYSIRFFGCFWPKVNFWSLIRNLCL